MDFLVDLEFSRIVLAFIVGFFLSLSGSLTQVATANSLASPSTLGMSALAVIGVILSYFTNFYLDLSLSFELRSFIIGLVLAGLILIIKPKAKNMSIWEQYSVSHVVLMGLAFNLFVGALFSIIQFVFMAFHLEFPASIWFGSLKQYSEEVVWIFIVLWLFIFISNYKISGFYGLLNYGADFALGFDQKVYQYQKRGLILALLMTISVVSFFGVFSFMGLVFPHLLRQFKFFKSDIISELRIGPWICGILFIILDQTCYLVPVWGAEVPVGMLSGLVGTLFLFMRLIKTSNQIV